MGITHIVMFGFKADVANEVVKDTAAAMVALKEKCIHPTSQKPYIVSLKGGTNNSPEKLANGLTHAFVLEFASVEDRDYYVHKDPAHQAFIGTVMKVADKATVLDFTDGIFE